MVREYLINLSSLFMVGGRIKTSQTRNSSALKYIIFINSYEYQILPFDVKSQMLALWSYQKVLKYAYGSFQ